MKFSINGQDYDSWAELPPELQRTLADSLPDADHDGIPDVFQGRLPTAAEYGDSGKDGESHTVVSSSFEVNGKHYDSVADLPPEIRALMARSVGLDGFPPTSTPASTPTSTPSPTAASTTVSRPPATSPAVAAQPAPGEVLLNGQPVAVDQAAGVVEKKGFLSRLLGR